jgi:hydrogenase nickel incorporation protein HypA/HybF
MRVHELSIVQALLDRIEEQARANGATAVRRVSVRLGDLSGVEPHLLASAYEVLRERTACCARAELAVERVPACWVCSACGTPVSRGAVLVCSACGAPARLAAGDEIVLERIEIEVP